MLVHTTHFWSSANASFFWYSFVRSFVYIELYSCHTCLFAAIDVLLFYHIVVQNYFLIQESLASDLEKTIVRVDEMMHNGVNIQRMIKDIERLRDDVEKLKDKVRENGNSYSSNNVSKQ